MARKPDPKIVEAARNRSSHSERGETQKYTMCFDLNEAELQRYHNTSNCNNTESNE